MPIDTVVSALLRTVHIDRGSSYLIVVHRTMPDKPIKATVLSVLTVA
jgi:hypothetical protein